MRPDVEIRKLKEPFQVRPDSEPIIGVTTTTYRNNNALAVLLVYENLEDETISTNISEFADMLEEGQFFLKDWTELEEMARRLQEEEIIQIVGEGPSGPYVTVKIAQLNEDKLECIPEGKERMYTPAR